MTDKSAKPWSSIWLQIQSLLNTINHIFIGLVAMYIFVLGKSLNFDGTAGHAFMTVMGWHVLAAEALMSHYPLNPITNRLSHRNKSRYHGVLQLLGGCMSLTGSFLKFQSKTEHFTTWHGIFGAAASCMAFASLLGGIVNYFQPKLAHKLYTAAEIKYRHNLFGMLSFTLGMLAIFLGYSSKFFYKYVDTEFIRAISLTTAIVYVLTMIAPVQFFLDKLKYRNKSKSQ